MPEHAMSYTPEVYEDQFGETHYDLSKGTFTSSAPVEAVQRANEHQQEEGWYEDEDGNTHHHTQFDEQDINNVLEMNGGAETYNAALEWAAYNLPEDDIDDYDEVMGSGDLTLINSYISQLMEMYSERTDEVSNMDDTTRYVYENICPPQEYEQVRSWVEQNLDEDGINSWNSCIDSGDMEVISNLINRVKQNLN